MRSGHGDAVCAILGKGGLFSFIHLFSFAISFGYQILFCRTFLIFAKLHRMRGICCSLGEPALKGWLPGSQGQMDGGRGLLDLCSPFPTAFGLARITHGSNTSVHTPLEVVSQTGHIEIPPYSLLCSLVWETPDQSCSSRGGFAWAHGLRVWSIETGAA